MLVSSNSSGQPSPSRPYSTWHPWPFDATISILMSMKFVSDATTTYPGQCSSDQICRQGLLRWRLGAQFWGFSSANTRHWRVRLPRELGLPNSRAEGSRDGGMEGWRGVVGVPTHVLRPGSLSRLAACRRLLRQGRTGWYRLVQAGTGHRTPAQQTANI
jgi:hypothetical protein